MDRGMPRGMQRSGLPGLRVGLPPLPPPPPYHCRRDSHRDRGQHGRGELLLSAEQGGSRLLTLPRGVRRSSFKPFYPGERGHPRGGFELQIPCLGGVGGGRLLIGGDMHAWRYWRGWAFCPSDSGDRCTFRTGRGSSFIGPYCQLTEVWPGGFGGARCFGIIPPPTTSMSVHTLAKPGVARRPPGNGWTPYVMKDVTPESILEGFRVLRNALPTPPTSLATPAGVSARPPPLEPSGFTDEVPRAEGLQRLLEGVSARVPQEEVSSQGDPEAQPLVERGHRRSKVGDAPCP